MTRIFTLIFLSSLCIHADSFNKMINGLLKNTVTQVTTETIAKEISTGNSLILLDTRPQKEYDVSHLPDAKHFGYAKADYSSLENVDKSTPIVTYCSVGKRSEDIGAKLKELGFSDVRNLRGGIFQWANEKRPLVSKDGKSTTAVHPYNLIWGKWLKPHVKKKYK